ncbi:hypothetical protein ACSS6W_003386 [Trichoderma asperelloides]
MIPLRQAVQVTSQSSKPQNHLLVGALLAPPKVIINEMSETKARQPCLPASRDKSMPTSRIIAFRSRL